MKRFSLTILLCVVSSLAFCQAKTYAFYMIGNYTNPIWEKLEFTLSDNGRTITYSYKKNETGYKLKPLGVKYVGNQKALMVRMPTSTKTYLIIQDQKGRSLLMMSEDGTYRKRFPLGYEGPVDGRGTACTVCANEPAEALEVVNLFFL